MYLLTLLLALLPWGHLTVALEDDQIYCSPRYSHLCMGKGQHVACQFPVSGSGPNCQNYTRIMFTSELRNYITNFINKRRQRIAAGHERVRGGKHLPATQLMMHVEWDFELARLAQRLADQCYFVHDECRATVKYPYAGQSVGEVRWRHLSNSDELSAQRGIRRVFDAWWGERRRVEPYQLTHAFRISDKGLDWGHFSQIAVWTLRAVGCGAVRHGEDYPRLLLVCDFSHTNMLGEKTLLPGAIAPCPDHTRRKQNTAFPLLCVSIKEQIKQSRIVEDDTLDETDYVEEDDVPGSDIMTARDSVKKFYDGTGNARHNEYSDWGNNHLLPSEMTIVMHEPTRTTERPTISTKQRTTTSPTFEEYDEKEEKYREEEDKYDTTTFSLATKPIFKRLRIKLKPEQNNRFGQKKTNRRTPKPTRSTTRKLNGKDKFKLSRVTPITYQETLILTATQPPLNYKNNKFTLIKKGQNSRPKSITQASIIVPNRHGQFDLRNRWKPERERPQRPGAAALLRSTDKSVPAKLQPAIPPRISFKMDEDVVNQLYEDTGFKPSWKFNRNETMLEYATVAN